MIHTTTDSMPCRYCSDKLFFATFGQKYRTLRDHYLVIWASDMDAAKEIMFEIFGGDWSMIYTEGSFQPSYFPEGRLSFWDAKQNWLQEQKYRDSAAHFPRGPHTANNVTHLASHTDGEAQL